MDCASRASKKAPQGLFCRRDGWRRPMLFESTRYDLLDMFLQNRNSSTRFGYWSSWWARVDYASRASKKAPQGLFCRRDGWRRPMLFESTRYDPLICFYKTETPVPGSDTGVLGGRGWIRTTEAEKQQIYSLSPLATREHAHILLSARPSRTTQLF